MLCEPISGAPIELGHSGVKGLEAGNGPVPALTRARFRGRRRRRDSGARRQRRRKQRLSCGRPSASSIRRAGEIRFCGRPIGALATEEIACLGIAHVPDGRGTFQDLTVEENLRLGAYVRSDRQRVRVDSNALRAPSAPRRAATPTGGNAVGRRKKMLAMARALLTAAEPYIARLVVVWGLRPSWWRKSFVCSCDQSPGGCCEPVDR